MFKKKEDPNNPDLLGLGDDPDAFFGTGGQGDGKVFTLDGGKTTDDFLFGPSQPKPKKGSQEQQSDPGSFLF